MDVTWWILYPPPWRSRYQTFLPPVEDSLKKFIPRSNGQKFKNLKEATEKETKHENTFGKFPDYVCNSGPFSDSYCFCSAAQHSLSCFLSFPPSLPSPLLPVLCLYVSAPVLSLSPLPYSLYPLKDPYIVAFCQFLLKIKGSTIPPSPVPNTVLILFRKNHLHLLQKFRKLCYTLFLIALKNTLTLIRYTALTYQ